MGKLVCNVTDKTFLLAKGDIKSISKYLQSLLVFLNSNDINYKTGKGWVVFEYFGDLYKIIYSSGNSDMEVVGIGEFINSIKRKIYTDYECLLEDDKGFHYYTENFGMSHITLSRINYLIRYWSLKDNSDMILSKLNNELSRRK